MGSGNGVPNRHAQPGAAGAGRLVRTQPRPRRPTAIHIRPTQRALDAIAEIHAVWGTLAEAATRRLDAGEVETLVTLLEHVRVDLGQALEQREKGSSAAALAG